MTDHPYFHFSLHFPPFPSSAFSDLSVNILSSLEMEKKCSIVLQTEPDSMLYAASQSRSSVKAQSYLDSLNMGQYMSTYDRICFGEKSTTASWCHTKICLNVLHHTWFSTPATVFAEESSCGLELWVIAQCLVLRDPVRYIVTDCRLALLAAVLTPAQPQDEVSQLFSQLQWQVNPVSCRKRSMATDAILGNFNPGPDYLYL